MTVVDDSVEVLGGRLKSVVQPRPYRRSGAHATLAVDSVHAGSRASLTLLIQGLQRVVALMVDLGELLYDVGLGELPVHLKNDLMRHLLSALQVTVGMRIAQRLTPDQLTGLIELIDAGDEEGALGYLELNCPECLSVVYNAVCDMRSELRDRRDEVMVAIEKD